MAGKRMLVALWTRPTHVKQGSDPATRLSLLAKALAWTESKRKAYHSKFSNDWAKPQVIFVAPEYLFGHPTGAQPGLPPLARMLTYTHDPVHFSQQRHLDERQANDILKKLKTLSHKYSNFLIVPGTIAWYKRFMDMRDRNLARVIIRQARDRLGLGNLDSLAEPWDSRAPAGSPPVQHRAPTPLDKLARLASFEQIAHKRQPTPVEKKRLENARLCLNTAVVLYEGRSLLVYHKQGDFHEVLEEYLPGIATQIALPGRKDGVFELEEIKYGIEVCLDHAQGALLGHHGAGARPLIHIVTSATVSVLSGGALDNNCCVVDGGFVMNASCDPNDTGLWSFSGGLTNPVPELQGSPFMVANSPLRLYGIRVPI